MNLSQSQLLDLLVQSIRSADWNVLVADSHKPFELRVFREERFALNLRIYIWNCTHGGGAARAKDEYRIQFTGVVPHESREAITLLLGWHGGYEVFAAWDIRRHDGQDSSSPSAQIREEILRQAHSRQFAVGTRNNGEIVVAFRPQFLIDYARVAATLHRTGIVDDLEILNDVATVSDADIREVESVERRQVVSTIVRRYRAADFRQRVLGAYGHRCAMCGIQLELLDAAHILPVAADNSTDETNNGVALCKLHHAAYDRNLVSFDENFAVEVSGAEAQRLAQMQRTGGLSGFRDMLKSALILPNDRRDYPSTEFISASRRVRNWAP